MSWNNSVKLIGRIVRDPKLTGTAVKFTVAVNRPSSKEEGIADFIPCTAFGKTADVASSLKRGEEVYVEGSFSVGSYVNKEGNNVYTYEVFASIIKRFEKHQNQPQQAYNQQTTTNSYQHQNAPQPQYNVPVDDKAFDLNIADDDLPF